MASYSDSPVSVSVVIVNWNSENLLNECIKTLNRQTVRPERIFIVDNASTDRSEQIANAPENLNIIKMPENVGFAAGNNRALAKCTSRFVALLNPDAFPATDWLEKLIEASNRQPDVAAFGSKQICYENAKILDGIGDCYHISGLVWRNRHGKRELPGDNRLREIFSPCAAAAMYQRSVLERIGGFDEDYFCYLEDVDLGFRIRLAGFKSIYVPAAVVHHVGSATTGGKQSDFAVYYGRRNLVWTFIKNMPGVLFWLFLPLHLILNIVTIGVFASRGQLKVILLSEWDSIKGIPVFWKKRRKLQNERVANIKSIWNALDKHFIPKK